MCEKLRVDAVRTELEILIQSSYCTVLIPVNDLFYNVVLYFVLRQSINNIFRLLSVKEELVQPDLVVFSNKLRLGRHINVRLLKGSSDGLEYLSLVIEILAKH